MILSVNAGSSSIKFALFESGSPARKLSGEIERIGSPTPAFTFKDEAGREERVSIDSVSDHRSAASFLIHWLENKIDLDAIAGVGHRIVHGMSHVNPEPVTSELLEYLRSVTAVDPDHLPGEIALMEAFRRAFPALPQVACFDTAFHASMPRVAKLLPLPRRFDDAGVRRYGFHGISCAYLMEELARAAGPKAAEGRVILAHLGGGASLTAVRDGKSIDTSMGFTPAAGVPMGTRPGDLDPGVICYLMQNEKMTPERINQLVNRESGLLGVSGTGADVRDLLGREESDPRAAEALALFCYQVRKWIGAFCAVLGGLDTLVFSGGIGANSPAIRARVCEGLGFLGIAVDEGANESGAAVISGKSGRVSVRVIRTDEELMIARTVSGILQREAK